MFNPMFYGLSKILFEQWVNLNCWNILFLYRHLSLFVFVRYVCAFSIKKHLIQKVKITLQRCKEFTEIECGILKTCETKSWKNDSRVQDINKKSPVQFWTQHILKLKT